MENLVFLLHPNLCTYTTSPYIFLASDKKKKTDVIFIHAQPEGGEVKSIIMNRSVYTPTITY